MYRIGNVRRDKTEGREHIVLATLLYDEDSVKLNGTLEDVIRICEERSYEVINLEQAKVALEKMR